MKSDELVNNAIFELWEIKGRHELISDDLNRLIDLLLKDRIAEKQQQQVVKPSKAKPYLVRIK
jgi:hypothetical protein